MKRYSRSRKSTLRRSRTSSIATEARLSGGAEKPRKAIRVVGTLVLPS
jgi:hypothetical protein